MSECAICSRYRINADLVSLHNEHDRCRCCRGCRERLRPFTVGLLEICPFCNHQTNIRGFAGRTRNYVLPAVDVIREHHTPTIFNAISRADINYFNHALNRNNFDIPDPSIFDDVDIFLFSEDYVVINRFWIDPIVRAHLVRLGVNPPDLTGLERSYNLRDFMETNRRQHPVLHIQDAFSGAVMTAFQFNTVETPRAYFERVIPLLRHIFVPSLSRLLNVNDQALEPQNLVNNINPIQENPPIELPVETIDIVPILENAIVRPDYEIEVVVIPNNLIEDNRPQIPYPRRNMNFLVLDTTIWIYNIIMYIINMILFLCRTPINRIHQNCLLMYNDYQDISQKYKLDNGYIYDIPDNDGADGINRPIVFGNNKTIRYKLWWIIPTFVHTIIHYLKIRVYRRLMTYLFNCRYDIISHHDDNYSGLSALDPYLTSFQVLNPRCVLGTYSNIYSTLGYSHYYIGAINVDCYEHIIQTRIAQINSSNVANTIAANVSQYFINNKIDVTDEIRVNTSMYALQRIRMMQYRMNNIPGLTGNSFASVPF